MREFDRPPFTGPEWARPTDQRLIATWRHYMKQVADDIRYLKEIRR